MKYLAYVLGWGAFLAVAFLVYVIISEAYFYQEKVGKPLQKGLGFRHGSPYVRCGDDLIEVFAIEGLTPGGVMQRAGFRNGDIIRGLSITEFYKLLHQNRGKEVTVCVVDGGDGPPLEERPGRHILFRVPMAKAVEGGR